MTSLTEISTKGPYYLMMADHLFRGVVAVPGGRNWKELRRPITYSMTVNLVQNEYYNIKIRRTEDFIYFLEKNNRLGKTWDCASDIYSLFADILAETHLGIPLNEVWERKLNYSASYERSFQLSMTSLFKYGSYWRNAVKFTKHASINEKDRKYCLECMKWILHERERIISEKIHPLAQDKKKYYTDFLLQRRKEKNLSEDQICLELADFIIAGTDTLGVFSASALLYLGMFPEIQEKAYQEQVEIFGDSDRYPTVDEIESMKYLEMIFKETGRHMGNPGAFKSCEKSFKLGNYTIPKNSGVFAFFNQTHRDPRYWEKPNDFYPEHFLPEKEAARPRSAFHLFGLGIRMCAAKQYGIQSFLIAISMIIRNFKITTPLKFYEISYELSLFLNIHEGYPIKLEKRIKNTSQV